MGFSTIGAGIVLFIGMLFVTTTVLSATFEGQRDVLEAVRDDRSRDRFIRETDAEITGTDHTGDWFTISVANTGGTTLTPSKTGLFLDGVWIDPANITREVDGDGTTDVWAPGETLDLMVDVGSNPEDTPNRAYVVLETGRGLTWTA